MTPPAFEELATFVVAMVILGGSFYGLLREDGAAATDHTAYVALIGVVGTFYFQRAAIGMAIKRFANGNGK